MIWDSRGALEAPRQTWMRSSLTLCSHLLIPTCLNDLSLIFTEPCTAELMNHWKGWGMVINRGCSPLSLTTMDVKINLSCGSLTWKPDLIWLACCCSLEHGQYLHRGMRRVSQASPLSEGKEMLRNFTLMKQQQVAVRHVIWEDWGFLQFPVLLPGFTFSALLG